MKDTIKIKRGFSLVTEPKNNSNKSSLFKIGHLELTAITLTSVYMCS